LEQKGGKGKAAKKSRFKADKNSRREIGRHKVKGKETRPKGGLKGERKNGSGKDHGNHQMNQGKKKNQQILET